MASKSKSTKVHTPGTKVTAKVTPKVAAPKPITRPILGVDPKVTADEAKAFGKSSAIARARFAVAVSLLARSEGKSSATVAADLGVSRSGAHNVVKAGDAIVKVGPKVSEGHAIAIVDAVTWGATVDALAGCATLRVTLALVESLKVERATKAATKAGKGTPKGQPKGKGAKVEPTTDAGRFSAAANVVKAAHDAATPASLKALAALVDAVAEQADRLGFDLVDALASRDAMVSA